MTEQEWLTCADPAAMLKWLTAIPGYANDLGQPCATDRQLRLFVCACARQRWSQYTDQQKHCVEAAEDYADGVVAGDVRAHFNRLALHEALESPEAWVRFLPESATEQDFTPWQSLQRAQRSGIPDALLVDFLRDIFGNPWCPRPGDRHIGNQRICERCNRRFDSDAVIGLRCSGCGSDHVRKWRERDEWLAWQGGLIPRMATQIYTDRDWPAMTVLGDALEDAGCTDEDILRHLRGQEKCPQCKGTGRVLTGLVRCDLDGIHDDRQEFPCLLCGQTGWLTKHQPVHVRGCWVIDLLRGQS